MKATIYTTRLCPYCVRAKQLLKHKSVDFDEVAVDGDSAMRQQLMERTGQHTVPQIWIGETHVGGCDDLFALERRGKLNNLLAIED